MFYIDIIIFGYVLATNVEIAERGIALLAILSGLTLKLVMANISSRTEDMPKLDIFLGAGFTALFKKDYTYIINPIKQLIRLQGPILEYIISFGVAFVFPVFGPDLVDVASLQEYLFFALTMGYAINALIIQFTETVDKYRQSLKNLGTIIELVDEVIDELREGDN